MALAWVATGLTSPLPGQVSGLICLCLLPISLASGLLAVLFGIPIAMLVYGCRARSVPHGTAEMAHGWSGQRVDRRFGAASAS